MITTLRAFVSRLGSFWRRGRSDAELAEELETHLEMAAEDYRRQGLAPEAARLAARRDLGNTALLRETHRAQRGFPWLDILGQDVRYGLRTLRRDLGTTAFSILVAGLGIAASATVFSVVNALLLQPLPFRSPERLVWIGNQADDGVTEWPTEVNHLLDLRRRSRTLSGIEGYYGNYASGDTKLVVGEEPERVGRVAVTCGFFGLLGVHPLLGRTFTDEECSWGVPPVVLLSHAIWVERFGASRSVVGQTIRLNGSPATVIGVLPPDFDFRSTFDPATRVDLYTRFPLVAQTDEQGNTLALVGRLRPDATMEQARTELRQLGRELTLDNPQRNGLRPTVAPLERHVSGPFRVAMLVLAAAVGLVMLIVCANLANVQLARGSARQREMAIRVALGAGRGRLIRQLLTESLMIAGSGALLGLLLAIPAVHIVAASRTISIPLLARVRIDGWVLAVTALLAIAAGVISGLAPALNIRPGAAQAVLRGSGRNSSGGRRQTTVRATLVVAEVALACVLLTGAGLLTRSLVKVLDMDPGFRPAQVAALRVDRSFHIPERPARNAHYDDLLQRGRAVHGVAGVALADILPLDGNRSWSVSGEGQVYEKGHYPEGFVRVVSDGYFRTLGIPLRQGRDFTEYDTPASPPVVIINERLAHVLWPGQHAIGQVLVQAGDVPRRVVGVVGDVRHRSIDAGPTGEFYLPLRQTNNFFRLFVVVRASTPLESVERPVWKALAPIEPELPRDWVALQGLVERAVSPRRFVVLLLGGFAVFALALASLGLYAVVSYSVNRRTQEIGVRMALGATASSVLRDVLTDTLRLCLLGLVLGLVAAWPVGRLLAGLLYDTAPVDPLILVLLPVVLLGVGLLAGYVPARRASRLQPLLALRLD